MWVISDTFALTMDISILMLSGQLMWELMSTLVPDKLFGRRDECTHETRDTVEPMIKSEGVPTGIRLAK